MKTTVLNYRSFIQPHNCHTHTRTHTACTHNGK